MTTWFTHFTSVVALAIGAAALWWWHLQNPGDPEPIASFIGAAALLVAATLAIPVHWFFDDDLKARRQRVYEQRRSILDAVLDRMDGEMENFRHISEKRNYSDEDHRRSVENSSFELLAEETEKVASWRGYRGPATAILHEIKRNESLPPGQKDVSRLVPLLAKLRPRVERELNKVGGPHEW